MTERWRSVRGFEGRYEVSDLGKVRGLAYGRILRPAPNSSGYLTVRLHKDGGGYRTVSVHRLVAEAFVLGERPGLEVRHYDTDNKRDNRATNLRWGTRSENMYDRVRHGTHQMTRKTHCKRDHEFTDDNTYITPRGARVCKKCRSILKAEYRARKAANS